jgi:hypothetical protein
MFKPSEETFLVKVKIKLDLNMINNNLQKSMIQLHRFRFAYPPTVKKKNHKHLRIHQQTLVAIKIKKAHNKIFL